MQGLDTNILVRYLVQDDPKQAKQATKIINQFTSEKPAFINRLVLCELICVLESCYEYSRETLVPVLDKLLRARQFKFENQHIVWQAFNAYQAGNDFADYLIGLINAAHGCEATLSFDKKACQIKEFTLLH